MSFPHTTSSKCTTRLGIAGLKFELLTLIYKNVSMEFGTFKPL